jgi:hypothetical protein
MCVPEFTVLSVEVQLDHQIRPDFERFREMCAPRTLDQFREPRHVVELPPPMFTSPVVSTLSVWICCWRRTLCWSVVVSVEAGHDAWVSIRP